MKFSIILPVRNGGEYVKECVASILSQTYTEFTLHVLDNNSTDGTLEWLNSINDSRIEITPSSTSLSIEENWARALSIKKNEFMTLIGHDDILFPNFLERMHEQILKNSEASLFLTHFQFIDAKGEKIRDGKPMLSVYQPSEFLAQILQNKIDITGTGFIMKSADYDQIEGIPSYYPNLLFADYDLWIKLANISKLVVLKENCFAFRLHQSTTKSSTDLKMIAAFEIFVSFLCKMNEINVEFSDVIKNNGTSFLHFHCKGLSHRLLRTALINRDGFTVAMMLDKFKLFASSLKLDFAPLKTPSILAAYIIDSNPFTRKLFLIFKSIFPKPVLK